MPENEQKIRIVCALEGYEDCWIEYDASGWGLGAYMRFWNSNVNQILTQAVPEYCVAWRMHDGSGTVIAHPGAGAGELVWQTVWDQFGVESSRILFPWLWSSVLAAINEAMTLSPKSGDNDTGNGAGVQRASERGESDAAG